MTRVYGLVGQPIGHSLSPALHRRAFEALGMDAAYLPFEIAPEAFDAAVDGARHLGLAGLNVTRPFKEQAARRCARLAPAAEAAGAVNVLAFRSDGSLEGDNTDGGAILWALAERGLASPAPGDEALILGAGGSARGAAQALGRAGYRLAICGRTPARAEALAEDLRAAGLSARVLPWAERVWAVAEAPLVVQCTPLGGGLKGKGSPLGRETADARWAPAATLVELAYGPQPTPLARAAARAGVGVVDGVEILCRQAALSWELWFGVRGPLAAMRQGAEEALAAQRRALEEAAAQS